MIERDRMRRSLPMREFIFGVALISATLISIFFLLQILNTLLAFLTPKKEECFNRVEPWRSGSMQQWNCEKLEVTRFLGLTPFRTFKERTTNKVSVSDFTFNRCSCCHNKFCFFVYVALISLILESHPLFRFNFLGFLYSK